MRRRALRLRFARPPTRSKPRPMCEPWRPEWPRSFQLKFARFERGTIEAAPSFVESDVVLTAPLTVAAVT